MSMQTATITAQVKDAANDLKIKGRVIDLHSLKELSGNDEAFIEEILGMFKNTSYQQVEDMKDSLEKDAFDILGVSAHKFKSSVSILGNSNLYELVTAIEHGAKYGGDKKELHEKLGILYYMVMLANEEIEEYLN
jgi:HPt (histidine-containing phosphotransfer) domain-containing protein